MYRLDFYGCIVWTFKSWDFSLEVVIRFSLFSFNSLSYHESLVDVVQTLELRISVSVVLATIWKLVKLGTAVTICTIACRGVGG